jgi:hypothetical protein
MAYVLFISIIIASAVDYKCCFIDCPFHLESVYNKIMDDNERSALVQQRIKKML